MPTCCRGFSIYRPPPRESEALEDQLLVICGSVNPITRAQLAYGEKLGFAHLHLRPEEKLEARFWDSEEGQARIARITAEQRKDPVCIIDSNDPEGSCDTEEYRRANGLSIEDIRQGISGTMGKIVKEILDQDIRATLLVTGGDTLLGFLREVHQTELQPITELETGCVLTKVLYRGKSYHVISKSGGFGAENLLETLAKQIHAI